jgi:hypothetical protein
MDPPLRCEVGMVSARRSEGLGDRSGAQATGADLNGLNLAFVQRFDFLQVGVPHLSGLIMRMADIVASRRSFATNIAYSGHDD